MSSDSFSGRAFDPAAPGGQDVEAALPGLGQLWYVPVFFGVVSLVFGVLVVAWPDVTIKVIAVLFGIHLIIYGVFRIIQALSATDAAGGERVLFALAGVLGLVAGVLCLRNVLQALEVIALLLGLFWLVGGVLQIVAAVGRAERNRALNIVVGVLGAVAGVFVLAYPDITLLTLAVILGIWLIILGVAGIAEGMALRTALTRNGR